MEHNLKAHLTRTQQNQHVSKHKFYTEQLLACMEKKQLFGHSFSMKKISRSDSCRLQMQNKDAEGL